MTKSSSARLLRGGRQDPCESDTAETKTFANHSASMHKHGNKDKDQERQYLRAPVCTSMGTRIAPNSHPAISARSCKNLYANGCPAVPCLNLLEMLQRCVSCFFLAFLKGPCLCQTDGVFVGYDLFFHGLRPSMGV